MTTPRALRQRQTPAERKLWAVLRDSRLDGWKFRRQHPAGRFVLDFYCPAAALVIELDGPIHAYQADYDDARTFYLETCGARVLRFRNDEVMTDLNGVLDRIRAALERPHPLPPSPPRWRGAVTEVLARMRASSSWMDGRFDTGSPAGKGPSPSQWRGGRG